MRLSEGLDQAPTGTLRRIAVVHGLATDPATTRAELLERLTARLADTAYLADEIARLEPAERLALEAVRDAGGQLRGFLLARILGGADDEAAAPLVERGLLFRTFSAVGPRRGEVFAAPDEILDYLGPSRAAADGALPAAEESPAERRSTDPTFSLFAVASFLQRHPAEREPPGVRGAAFHDEVEHWSQEPGGWEWQERWAFLRHVAVSAGLLEHTPRGGFSLGHGLSRLLSNPPALTERLWRAYVRDREWSELARSHAPRREELAEQVDASLVRESILHRLRSLPEGAWFRVSDISAWLQRTAPSFLREQLDARSILLTDPDTGDPLLEQGAWDRVEGELLRSTLLGPLYWLGVVAASADGEHVSLTRSAAALVSGGVGEALARAVEACSWTEEGELLVPPRADLGAVLDLERYLVLEERGRPSRYRLDSDRLGVALAAGGTVAECRHVLERLTQSELPEPVSDRLATWEQRFGALVLRPAVVLEGRTEADLDAALEDRTVRNAVRTRLGPTAAEVPASEVLDIAAALRAGGQLPRVDAALRLMAGRRAYASLVDEQILEFLLVSLLAFQRARPERLAELEGALTLIERLEGLFPSEKLQALEVAAERLAGDIREGARGGLARPRRRRSTRRG